MLNYFIDTEAVGLHSVPVTIQYAINKGPAQIHHIWTAPVYETLELIEDLVDNRVIAHRMVFDWFQIQKVYNMLSQVEDRNTVPIELPLKQLADMEFASQYGPCLKPRDSVCTLLLAQKSEAQLSMKRKPIFIRQVPSAMAEALRQQLEERTHLPDIMFARNANIEADKWKVVERKNEETGEVEMNWVDLKLGFNPSNGLKDLAKYLLDYEPFAKFDEVVENLVYPMEAGYAPYVNLISSEEDEWLCNGKPTWPILLKDHVDHWSSDPDALAYAFDDIEMLRNLYEHFGSPIDDADGVLSCQVASVRLRGFAIDHEKLEVQYAVTQEILSKAQLNPDSPVQVRNFIAAALDPMEQLIVARGCDQEIIDDIKKLYTLDKQEDCYCGGHAECHRCEGVGMVGPDGSPCEKCEGTCRFENEKCRKCSGTGLAGREMPVVKRAKHVEQLRSHMKRRQLFDKLRLAKRFYASFNVIGAKSGRMSGTDGLNAQGIESSNEVRDIFCLADEGWILSAGDYSSQELAIAVTSMNDDDLMKDMETGKSLHGLFGAELFQTTYEDIMENKKEENSRYGRAKSAVYLTLYGGTYETMAAKAGVPEAVAKAAFENMVKKYPQMGNMKRAITERFTALENGVYTEVPEKFIESLYGFKRHFDVEYDIQRLIYDLSNSLPDAWKALKQKVQRREGRVQTLVGAILSAMYGAMYSIQNGIIRASNNHIIQSTGRTLTVGLQHEVWKLQPQGIHEFVLLPATIHDELFVVSRPETVPTISKTVGDTISNQQEKIPLLAMEWVERAKSWANKGDHSELKFGWVAPEEAIAA